MVYITIYNTVTMFYVNEYSIVFKIRRIFDIFNNVKVTEIVFYIKIIEQRMDDKKTFNNFIIILSI